MGVAYADVAQSLLHVWALLARVLVCVADTRVCVDSMRVARLNSESFACTHSPFPFFLPLRLACHNRNALAIMLCAAARMHGTPSHSPVVHKPPADAHLRRCTATCHGLLPDAPRLLPPGVVAPRPTHASREVQLLLEEHVIRAFGIRTRCHGGPSQRVYHGPCARACHAARGG